jgi:hypothetical protein
MPCRLIPKPSGSISQSTGFIPLLTTAEATDGQLYAGIRTSCFSDESARLFKARVRAAVPEETRQIRLRGYIRSIKEPLRRFFPANTLKHALKGI